MLQYLAVMRERRREGSRGRRERKRTEQELLETTHHSCTSEVSMAEPSLRCPSQINKEWHFHLTEQSVNPSTNYPGPVIQLLYANCNVITTRSQNYASEHHTKKGPICPAILDLSQGNIFYQEAGGKNPKCSLKDGHDQKTHKTPSGKGPNLKPLNLIRANLICGFCLHCHLTGFRNECQQPKSKKLWILCS